MNSYKERLIPVLMAFGERFDPIERRNEVNALTDKAISAITEVWLDLLEECIGAELRYDDKTVPKYLKPQGNESWEGVIRYEQGYNAAQSDIRNRAKRLLGLAHGTPKRSHDSKPLNRRHSA